MEQSRVYYASASLSERGGPLKKLEIILQEGKFLKIIQEKDVVAIKLHFGELGNSRYLRPIWIRKLADLIGQKGATPFMTDTTSLYKHARHTWYDYLETARKNGFTPETIGCPLIIADGIKSNGVRVEIENPLRIDQIKVAQAIYDADIMICVTHLTLHGGVGIGGAIKNVAMGCTTKETKMAMHTSTSKPIFSREKCILCGLCLKHCPGEAFSRENKQIIFAEEKCVGCGNCIAFCKGEAIKVPWGPNTEKGIIDGFRGVVSSFGEGRIIYVTLGLDITGDCDCLSKSDLPVVPDIGILVSLNPLALDKASWDLITQAPGYPNSKAEAKKKGEDILPKLYPKVDLNYFWKACQEKGLGNLNYELIRID